MRGSDITAFKATQVPVGDDPLPMIEQANELVCRFNSTVDRPVLVECEAVLPQVARLAILHRGTMRVREVAAQTLSEVKGAFGLTCFGS